MARISLFSGGRCLLFRRWHMGNESLTNFHPIIQMIETSRKNALRKVNEELINLYYNIGKLLSEQAANHAYGDRYIDEVAKFIAQNYPDLRGFNRRGLYRMRQFYETYRDDSIVSPLVTQISWSNHLLIMSSCKTAEQHHFYLSLCAKEHYSKRQLERQLCEI
jgi:predicted nuclease of restriction endonuclease-like (RecB) superfamily